MNAARRSKRKRDWPRGLYEPRPGYYIWRSPAGKATAIGAADLADAISQAIEANHFVAGQQPTLVQKLKGETKTVAEVLALMPASPKYNTAKTWRSLDKKILASLGSKAVGSLTVLECRKPIKAAISAGNERMAQAVRSRLIAMCNFAMGEGLMDSNPAEKTAEVSAKVQRGRLTLEQFEAIHAVAGQVAEWLPQAMMLALVTGADRSSLAALQRSDIADGYLTITRPKTGARVSIPTGLRMDAIGKSIADVLAWRSGVLSPHLLHHVTTYGNAPAGSQIHPDRISHHFTEARKLAGVPDEKAPTFHEIRSLCKRLLTAQGGIDTKALLGHSTERMSELYANPRGVEPIVVSIGQVNKS